MGVRRAFQSTQMGEEKKISALMIDRACTRRAAPGRSHVLVYSGRVSSPQMVEARILGGIVMVSDSYPVPSRLGASVGGGSQGSGLGKAQTSGSLLSAW